MSEDKLKDIIYHGETCDEAYETLMAVCGGELVEMTDGTGCQVGEYKVVDEVFALEQEIRKLQKEVARLHCPKSYGFEGAETYPDCGSCVVCQCKEAVKKESERSDP